MKTLFFTVLCFISSTCFAQTVGDTLSFAYVRTLQSVSEQTYYHVGANEVDLLLVRTGATVTIVKISEDGAFTVAYMESFLYEDDAIFIFRGRREMMLPTTK